MKSLPVPGLVSHTGSGIVYLTDDALFEACGVRIAFSGRHGGVSSSPFASLNLGTHVGDALAAVEENRSRLLSALDAPDECAILSLNQVHGTQVLTVRSDTRLDSLRETAQAGADGVAVAADVDDVAALLCFADCVPLILVAPDGTFAVAHAGWRGVMGEIAAEAIRTIQRLSHAAQACDINVYIGPHIRSCCFEVSPELAQDFGQAFGSSVVAGGRHVDLAEALRVTLDRCGIAPERVCDAGVCTSCTVEDFYSYRAEGGQCGRHGAVAFRGR